MTAPKPQRCLLHKNAFGPETGDEAAISPLSQSKHGAFYRNALWQYGLQAIKYLLPLITIPYLTRVLEPDGYAVYGYVVSFMVFAQVIVDFGFNLSGTKQIAQAQSVAECNRVVGAITQARLLLCAATGCGVLIAAWLIPLLHANLAYTMLAYVAVCILSLAPDFLFQGKERMGPLTTRYFAADGTVTILIFVLIHSSADLIWIPCLNILGSSIALAWSFVSAKRLFGTTMARVSFRSSLRELRVSGLYCLSNMASATFSTFTTVLIGIVITNEATVAYWSLSMSVVAAVQALYSPIINSLYPHMVVQGDFSFAKKTALVALPVVGAATAAVALLAPLAMLLLGGPAYEGAVPILQALSPVLFFSFFAMLFGWPILGAADKVNEITLSAAFSAVFCIVSLLALVALGRFDIFLVCAVRDATEVLLCAIRLFYCRKHVFTKQG